MILTIAARELRSLFLSPLAWSIMGVVQFVLALLFLFALQDFLVTHQARLHMYAMPLGVTDFVVVPLYNSASIVLMMVVPLDDLWIVANYKETQLKRVKPGQPVEIEVDTYPGLTLKGRVESIMAGTGSAFSLFPPENASGNFVKVVQRIPVRITLDAGQPGPELLRVGMSVVPTILTEN